MILQEKGGGVSFYITVITRASHSAINGVIGDTLRIRVNSPPVENKANSECITLLSKVFSTAKKNIEITGGHKSRRKTIYISNLTADKARHILNEHLV